ncbi:hypothetical protein CNMCM7691_003661 [Aspergillus felis]|uniref:Uncharacterized protein n=1 Tax=Aspergillus felis TaxID=1287682 RepID=A0A8H6VAD5_9EURO|nr:hypothetical protein CNMCM7691_003661 [Aspergillus felis]
MQSWKKVRLFRDLWLPDPEQALSSQELIYVQKLIPLIQGLEMLWDKELKEADGQICSLGWNLDEAYERLQENEATWWKARGVTRPREFLVRPSGKLNAPVACHLYNPTFSVDDPCCQKTEDLSNPSIAQLHEAGFSTKNNCLLFDHLARRDISRHCKDNYPEDLFDLHEQFVFALRVAMKAKVEICWGANVRQRMLKKLDLKPLRLWGDFAGLVLYLELTPDKASLRRFIIFVAHPQRFMYVKSDGEKTQGWRRRFGSPQDQALALAASLGGIRIPPNFYELDSRLPRNLFKESFPGAVLFEETSHRIRATKEEKLSVQKVFGLLAQLKPGQVNETANLPSATDDTILRNDRLRKIASYWHDLGELLSAFIPNITTTAHHIKVIGAQSVGYFSSEFSTEFQLSDCWDWEDLPDPLVEFTQAQDGLKFNRRKISSRTDLEVAFYLLQKCKGSPETLDILTLAISVLAAYGWMIARPRKPCVDDMLILRKSPNDIVPRKCSECGKEQLDDPFAYWSKFDPSRYKNLEHPVELEVKCQGENCQETKTVKARWTGHATPKFVVAVHPCVKSSLRTNWIPTGYPTIQSAKLSTLWKRFREAPGFDVTRYPRRPDIYFNTSLGFSGRIAALIEAQRLIEADGLIERKRKADEMDEA